MRILIFIDISASIQELEFTQTVIQYSIRTKINRLKTKEEGTAPKHNCLNLLFLKRKKNYFIIGFKFKRNKIITKRDHKKSKMNLLETVIQKTVFLNFS